MNNNKSYPPAILRRLCCFCVAVFHIRSELGDRPVVLKKAEVAMFTLLQYFLHLTPKRKDMN